MFTVMLIMFFALSASVSIVLAAACALAGRTPEGQLHEGVEMMPSIAEVKLPAYHLRPALTVQ